MSRIHNLKSESFIICFTYVGNVLPTALRIYFVFSLIYICTYLKFVTFLFNLKASVMSPVSGSHCRLST